MAFLLLHSFISLSFSDLIMMRGAVLCFLVLFLHILSLVGASSRNLDLAKDKNIKTFPLANKVINKIGSGPPSCAHKCYGCMPCEAIQVPTKTGRVRVQYTNYEPEGWKCKCGPTFYTP